MHQILIFVPRKVGHKQFEVHCMQITKVGWQWPDVHEDNVFPFPDEGDLFPHDMGLSDTESFESVAGTPDPVAETPEEPEVVANLPRNVVLRMALVTLDEIDLCAVFRQTAAVMKSVPHVVRGPFWNALKLALEEATWGNHQDDEVRQEMGWKLFMLLPRMLFHRPPGGGLIPRAKLVARFEAF